MKNSLLRTFWVVVTTIVLICIPQCSFASGGHGGGGGFHGGGGFGGGGFHGGGGFGGGGFHGGGGWHGFGGYGFRGGYGWHGRGYPGWGYGWGWGLGIGFGWGWGPYWGAYPYAYGYPYYYPSYSPYYPYYGPYSCPPGADSDCYRGQPEPHENPQRQNSSAPAQESSPGTSFLTANAPRVPTTLANYRTGTALFTAQRQEVRNVIQALQAMPPDARQRQIESGRYSNFSPEEQELLERVAQTPNVSASMR
jgi:hypothetical protein